MTIQRQYQLPNCSLILDGLSIDPTPGSEEVMSLLVNAECRISGLERSINGSYNFFAALVRAVSQYGQEVLSGYAHPQVVEGEPLLVHINPGDGPYHHLVIQPEIADLGESGDGRAIDIKLSAVQLFDLTEAVDQFFADSQTLPELEAGLSPLPRRFVRTDAALSTRAMPAVLGVGGLLVATMALGLLPVPELRDPSVDTRPREAEVQDASGVNGTANDTSNGEPPSGEGDVSELEASNITAANPSSPIWDQSPQLTDEGEVAKLQQMLETQIADGLDPEASFTEPSDYQVAVNQAGDIVGFKFNNKAAGRNIDRTPLPRLTRANVDSAGQEDQAIAQYQVSFIPEGVAITPFSKGTTVATTDPNEAPEVSPAETPTKTPDNAESATPSSAQDGENASTSPETATDPSEPTENGTTAFDSYDDFKGDTDVEAGDGTTDGAIAANTASATFSEEPSSTLRSLRAVERLNNQLKRTIVDNREQPRVGGNALTYRVRVTDEGTITGYQPASAIDAKAIGETPLPNLVESAPEDDPSVDYRVVFTERGVVEVSPWWGWSFYE